MDPKLHVCSACLKYIVFRPGVVITVFGRKEARPQNMCIIAMGSEVHFVLEITSHHSISQKLKHYVSQHDVRIWCTV